jgi:hypothetical protein
MKTRHLVAAIIVSIIGNLSYSQTVVVTDDAAYTTGHASSVLDVKSISKGLLIPRLTQAQRNSVSSPATGLMIYQSDATAGFYYYNGSGWVAIGPTYDGSETKLSQGTNVTITGSGTTGSPYVINAAGGDGSETKLSQGTNVTITGSGTSGSPYIINSTGGGSPSVTQAQRNALTPTAGTTVWCNNCGPSGEMQVYNGSSWVNMTGGGAAPTLPTLGATTAVSAKLSTTATTGGNITYDGGGTITARGVCWSTASNPTVALTTKTNEGSGTSPNPFTSNITGMSPSTLYYVRSYATNSAGTAYGTQISFTTLAYAIGHPAFGGRIAYLSSATHGFVVSTYDISVGSQWGCMGSNLGATSSSGYTNTQTIIYGCNQYDAAGWNCYNTYDGDGYPEWCLPSSSELTTIYNNRVAIGLSYSAAYYWSSTEVSGNQAYARRLDMITTQNTNKDQYLLVRAIRNF